METKFINCFNSIMPGGPGWDCGPRRFSGIWVEVRIDSGPWYFAYDANGDYFGTVHKSGLSDTEMTCLGCNPPPPPVYQHISKEF